MNPKNQKTIGFNVPLEYPFKGAEVKAEIDAFFQYVVDNYPEAFKTYPKLDKIREVLGKW
jgi:hypothetical protein